MSNDTGRIKPGWQGRKDSMREAAEKTLMGERKGDKPRRDGTGKFHKLTKEQTNLYLPKKVSVKMPPLYNHGRDV